MPLVSKHTSVPLLPPQVLRAVRLGLRAVWGGLLAFAVVYVSAALLYYSPMDNAWNTASSAVANPMGVFGAAVADVLMQFFGAVSWGLLATLGLYSAQIILRTTAQPTAKRACSLFGAALLTGIVVQSFYGFQVSVNDALPAAPRGGVFGFLLARKLYFWLQSHGASRWFPAAIMGVAIVAFSLWKYSTHLTFRQLKASVRRTVGECQKLVEKVRALRHLSTQEIPLFAQAPAAEEVAEDSEVLSPEILTDLFPVAQAPNRPGKRRTLNPTPRARAVEGTTPLPPVDLLRDVPDQAGVNLTKETLAALSRQLLSVLSEFGVQGAIVDVKPGPVVTLYEFCPAPGIKTSRVISLADDIARSMSALSVRIATIPGRNVIGIELPNEQRQTVFLRPLLGTAAYCKGLSGLPLILGKDIAGKPVLADLAKMPHLLVAGTTGSGKSVSINTMILSLLYRFTPSQCRFIMVDPKMLELSVYDDIPHLLTPVVTEPKKAVAALKWAVQEMEERYRAMSRLGVRNIDSFNERIRDGYQKGDVFTRHVQTGFDPETGKPVFEDQPLDYKELPYIVIVVDEMADLMLVAGKEIEAAVQRLAQMARAAGLHLIMATQRPSVDVITGTIKANFPTRISFQVTSKIDSRTILGEQGAEQLLGQGDMLYMSGGGRVMRVHGPFVTDNEVERVAKFLKEQGDPEYVEGITSAGEDDVTDPAGEPRDELFQQAVDLVRGEGRVSISYIQRRFQIGYNKAARLVEQMEKEGIVSPPDHKGKREIL